MARRMNRSPRCSMPIRLMREDGREEHYEAIAAVETQLAFELLNEGGVIPKILKKHLPRAA